MEKDKLRAKQMFAAMSTKEKLKHIGRYYWPHISATVLALAIAIGVGVTMYSNYVRSGWLHVGSTAPYSTKLRPALEALGQENDEPLNYLELMSVEGEYGADAMTQLSCYLAADQVDIVVCDDSTREWLLMQDGDNLTVYPLAQTTLTELFDGLEQPELFLVVRGGVSRSDRAATFAQLLITEPNP